MKQIEIMICIPSGSAVRLVQLYILSVWRFANSPNPSDSEWFSIGITVGPRFKDG